MNDALATKMLAGIDRIEKRQAVYEAVVHRMLTCMEVHNEKIDRLIAEIMRDPGPSPTTAVLSEILATMNRQVELLEQAREDELTPVWDEGGKLEDAVREVEDKMLAEPVRGDAH